MLLSWRISCFVFLFLGWIVQTSLLGWGWVFTRCFSLGLQLVPLVVSLCLVAAAWNVCWGSYSKTKYTDRKTVCALNIGRAKRFVKRRTEKFVWLLLYLQFQCFFNALFQLASACLRSHLFGQANSVHVFSMVHWNRATLTIELIECTFLQTFHHK